MALNTYSYKILLLLILIVKSSIVLCQLEMIPGSESISIENMKRKKVPIRLCFDNKKDTNEHIHKLNKIIYDQNDILKTIKTKDIKYLGSIIKFELLDTFYNKQNFINIPGYTTRNETIFLDDSKRYSFIIPAKNQVCKRFVLDFSDIKYKSKSGYDYFLQIFMVQDKDTVYANSPIKLKIK